MHKKTANCRINNTSDRLFSISREVLKRTLL